MIEFVERNGATFEHGHGGLQETAEAIEMLAADHVTEHRFSAWVAARVRE
jgi:hypothetical protein